MSYFGTDAVARSVAIVDSLLIVDCQRTGEQIYHRLGIFYSILFDFLYLQLLGCLLSEVYS